MQQRFRIYRPLIGFDKEEIVIIAREIGPSSNQSRMHPGVGVPKGPSTKAKLDTILDIEAKLEATIIPLPVYPVLRIAVGSFTRQPLCRIRERKV